MLTGTELGVAIAAVLLGAVGLGALLHWLWSRMGRVTPRDRALVTELIEDLHQTESRREAVEQVIHEIEQKHARREEHLESELAEARSDLETMHQGLINARQRLIDLEAELERLRKQG